MGLLLVEAKRRGISFIDIEKEKVEKTKVQSYIRKKSPDVIILNGHGNDDSVTGDDSKDIVSITDDLKIVKGKKIYVRSCSSGKKLGPEIIKNGGAGFVGYQDSFLFATRKDSESFHDPTTDDVAGVCLAPSNTIAEALIKGSAIREAHEKGIKASREMLDKLQISSSYNSQFAPFLYWNMVNQVCYE
jgi:hypothetical protein